MWRDYWEIMTNTVQEYHTGLYIDQKKCSILLDIVKDLLRNRYQLAAIAGLQLPDHTCEILLRPLHLLAGVNFVEAQALLVKYLSMIKESRPKMFVVNEPELIDLGESDDEHVDDPSVVIVDLDESNITTSGQKSEKEEPTEVTLLNSKWTIASAKSTNLPSDPLSLSFNTNDVSRDSEEQSFSVVNLVDSEIDITDSVKEESSPSKLLSNVNSDTKCSQHNESNSPAKLNFSDVIFVDSITKKNSLLQTPSCTNNSGKLHKNSHKKKKKKGKVTREKRAIQVVEILDDDVIVLDDSYTITNQSKDPGGLSESGVSVVKLNSVHSRDIPLKIQMSGSSPSSSNNQSSSSSSSVSPDFPQSSKSQTSNVQQNEGKDSCEDKFSCSEPPKKKSKLSYRRPAHLVTPLTQPTVTVPSTKVDSVSNIYNPNADSSEKRSGLRPIVIDGNNVAIGHGKGMFSLKGIKICVNYFEKRGHRQIKVFMPNYRKNRDTFNELCKMERDGLVVMTPSRKVNGKVVASYDDRYIVQYASEFGGVIVSTDNYRDLMDENPSWKETIERRLLMFTWVDDLLMFPQDPLGRRGPSLDDFLKFPDT